MVRNALPQNHIEKSGTLLEAFQAVGDWTTNVSSMGDGTIVADTDHIIEGVQSIKVTPLTSGSAVCVAKTISSKLFHSDRNMALDVYLHTDPVEYGSIWVYISASSTLGSYMYQQMNISTHNLRKGWNRIPINAQDWVNTATSWNVTMVKLALRFTGAVGKTPSISFGSLRLAYKGKPKCLIMFDAGYASGYSEGVVYAQSKGVRGTIYTYPEAINVAGRITTAQLADSYAKGWAVGNYPIGWLDAGVTSSQITAQAEVERVRNALNDMGYTRASNHVAYPIGAYTDFTDLAMSASGMKTGRAGDNRQYLPLYTPYRLGRYSMGATVTLTTAKSYLMTAKKLGIPVAFLFHTLTASPTGNDWSIANFQALIDFAIAMGFDFQTIDEFYEGLTNPRYRSIPVNRTLV